jgi:sulfur carrier protein ThiS
MSDPKTSTERILVHLLRPGVGAEDYQLSKGATLADLLGRSGATTKNQAVFLDGVLAEESAPLQNGSIVTIAPRPRNARFLYETYKPRPAKQAVPGFIDWRDFEPSWLPGGEQAPLATELVTYRDRLDELLVHKGQFVVIKGKSVLGYYRDRPSALAAAFKEYGAVPVLVKQIVEIEPVRRLGSVVP